MDQIKLAKANRGTKVHMKPVGFYHAICGTKTLNVVASASGSDLCERCFGKIWRDKPIVTAQEINASK